MTCDRGTQFASHLWEELCAFLGCKLVHTAAFHPESNGFLERLHRTLKAALKAQNNPRDLYSNLGLVLLGLRSTPKADIDVSSTELRLGTTLRLPGQFFEEPVVQIHSDYCTQLSKFMSTIRAPPTQHHDTPRFYVEKALQACTHVFMKHDGAKSTFDIPYCGLFKVLHKHDKYFTLDLGTRVDNVFIHRLKPAHLEHDINDTSLSTAKPSPHVHYSRPSTPPSLDQPAKSNDEQPTPILRTRTGRAIHRPKRYVQFILPTH